MIKDVMCDPRYDTHKLRIMQLPLGVENANTQAVKRVLGTTWERNGSLPFSNNVISSVKSKLILWVMFCLGPVHQTEVCRKIGEEG